MKSTVRIIEVLEQTAGKFHSWVKAEVIKPKNKEYSKGDIIKIRKPNKSL